MNKNTQNQIANLLDDVHLKTPLYNTAMFVAQKKALRKLKKIKDGWHPIDIANPKKIIFHCIQGIYSPAIYKEAAIAKALQLQGHNVKMILCGGMLSNCSWCFNKDTPPNLGMCKNCISFGKKFFDIMELPYSYYNNYINEEREFEIDAYRSKVLVHAEAATQKYFKGNLGDNKQILFEKIRNCVISYYVANQVYQKEKPDVIVTSHSCYEWGPFSDYFRTKNIPVYTWATGYHPNALIFDLGQIDKGFQSYYNGYRKRQALTSWEQIELMEFTKRRECGFGDTSLYGFTQTVKTLDDVYPISQYEKVYGLFPNLPWDADQSCKSEVFESVQDWVKQTIDLFKDHPKDLLIIKTHPAEKVYQSTQSIYDYVKTHYVNLHNNIIILPPDTEISAYDLFEHLDFGIVANSTTGLEMLLSGIPVIVVGQAHYKGKGFTYDINSVDEYKQIFHLSTLVNNKDIRDVYAYYYFIKSQIPFDVFDIKGIFNFGYNIKSFDTLNTNTHLHHITECIVNGKQFQRW